MEYADTVTKHGNTTPWGWVSIEDELPRLLAVDYILRGYTEYSVRYNDGSIGVSKVSDPTLWYYEVAIPEGIIEWWNPCPFSFDNDNDRGDDCDPLVTPGCCAASPFSWLHSRGSDCDETE